MFGRSLIFHPYTRPRNFYHSLSLYHITHTDTLSGTQSSIHSPLRVASVTRCWKKWWPKLYVISPNSRHRSFYFTSDVFQNKPQKSPKIWDTFVGSFVGKNFQKLPNLVTLTETDALWHICHSPGLSVEALLLLRKERGWRMILGQKGKEVSRKREKVRNRERVEKMVERYGVKRKASGVTNAST